MLFKRLIAINRVNIEKSGDILYNSSMEYLSFNEYMKNRFGQKVYKICIDGGFTCPNRDGTIDTRGCIFCSSGGSGDFAESADIPISKQIELGKKRVENKFKGCKYIAYFQPFTNTYAPTDILRKKYYEAIESDDIVAISIATRPDCISTDTINLLKEINQIKPVFVELGLQTIHKESAEYIRRGYDLSVYDSAVEMLKSAGINTVVHLILGLPNETKAQMLESVKYVCDSKIDGIKLQLLYILKNTDLADDYLQGKFKALEFDEYLDIIKSCVEIIPKNIVIHRLTGDGAKKDLIAPLWSADKKRVLNAINNL